MPPPTDEVISVSTLNRLARSTLENNFPLRWITGEVSGLTRAASGHFYFCLKDEQAQVRCTMFRNRAQLLPFRLEEGMQVDVRALVTLFEARGEFQLHVEAVRRAGLGALFEAYLRLRDKLQREGLFDAAAKRQIPRYPRRVGIITSPQAAALRDILAALARRAPHLQLVIYPTSVQGEAAGRQIAESILIASRRAECDVLVVARGGGSIEDLWAFNEEAVARAARACSIPVVSGVGHETDTTIIDLAADQRAATPTAAAELITAGFFDAATQIRTCGRHLRDAWQRKLLDSMQRVDLLSRRLVHPGIRLAHLRVHVDHLRSRMAAAAVRRLERAQTRLALLGSRRKQVRPDLTRSTAALDNLARGLHNGLHLTHQKRKTRIDSIAVHLEHLNPSAVLARGYSITRDEEGRIVRSASALRREQRIRIDFAVGRANATVMDTTEMEPQPVAQQLTRD